MFGYELSIERPAFLLLLLLIPALWWVASGGVSVAQRGRWLLANGLRSLLCLLVILALAEVELVRKNDRLTVLYLVDRSLSIPPERLEQMIDYVGRTANMFRQATPEDRVGVISFGGQAAIEVPPWADDVWLESRFDGHVDRQQTNLEAALKLAQAAFPPDTAKRVVVVTDGQETLGDAYAAARSLAEAGIGIDVVPITTQARSEVSIEKITSPAALREKSPFNVQVVLKNQPGEHWDQEEAHRPVPGTIRVVRKGNGREEVVVDQQVALEPGTKVFTFQEELADSGFYTYEAQFTPEARNLDGFTQNNRATSFTNIESTGQVLLIVDSTRPDEFNAFAEFLRENELGVTIQPSNQLFTSLTDLQRFDLVILGNVARSSGDQELTAFSDAQMQMLADNTRNLGAGLLMLGGPDSFGAGGWNNTPIEAAMPLDFQIKDAKVVPVGALMLVIDTSGSMAGEKIRWSQAAAREALRALGPRDYIGVVAFDSEPRRAVPLQKAENRGLVLRMVARLAAGGGTDLFPAMEDGFRQLQNNDAAVKHMIVLTDGQTPPAQFPTLAREMASRGITVTTVAVGQDADVQLLNQIARIGTGKFYQVTSPRAIPRIFMQEARRVSRPLVFEDLTGISPQVTGQHEILTGIASTPPPLTGFVMTTPKESPLVDVVLASPKPEGQANALLATWQYGLGRSVAWTSDVGQRWTTDWREWEGRDKLLLQMVRWTMRSTGQNNNFLAATEVDGQRVKVVLNALDDAGNFVNFATPRLNGVGPNSEPISATLQQVAPGRYQAEFDAKGTGAHFLAISTGIGEAPLRLGVNVEYSQEFQKRSENRQMLQRIAALVPHDGQPGQMFDIDLTDEQLAATDTTPFRHDLPQATSQQAFWYLILVTVACLFLMDVANRRILWDFAWAKILLARVFARPVRHEAQRESLGRLKAQKENLNRQWSQEFGSAPDVETFTEFPPAEPVSVPADHEKKPQAKPLGEEDEPNYLDRLLHAKRAAARQERGSN